MPLPNETDHTLHVPEALVLMPERAVFAPARGTLFVADVHIGKAAVFRARGIPVPHGTTGGTLHRLSTALRRSGATRLIVLGDFLHARESQAPATMAALAQWRQEHPALDCLVVEGNHDRHAGRVHGSLGIRTLEGPYESDGLRGVHDPAEFTHDGVFTLAGHVHPAVRLGNRHDTLRLPCFWRQGRLLTLPAFGEFTGGFTISRGTADDVFVVSDRVQPVPRSA